MSSRALFFALILAPLTLCGATIVDPNPIGSIQGHQSLLNRPEGIAFSPLGNCFAIANSDADNVLFYNTSDCRSRSDAVTPIYVLGAPVFSLGYPHDVAFSPDGSQLAVASRKGNRLTIHQRDDENGFYHHVPSIVVDGRQLGLLGINAVKYDPAGNILAVCDVIGNQVVLFRCDAGKNEVLGYQILKSYRKNRLDRPDGVAFSSDGSLLAVTSHGTHSVWIYERNPRSEYVYSMFPVEILQGDQTQFCFTHSLCFHPIDDTLVVSSAGGRKTLSLFKKLSDTVPRYSTTPSQTLEIYNPETVDLQRYAPEEGGVKGVAFSNDGRILGICASDIADPARAILFYSVE